MQWLNISIFPFDFSNAHNHEARHLTGVEYSLQKQMHTEFNTTLETTFYFNLTVK